ncbi:MAG TPA: RNA chaperone Hfq [Terriglobales bacterium]|nr:RNA chaperone Hfq [Terriglobales bacterium]
MSKDPVDHTAARIAAESEFANRRLIRPPLARRDLPIVPRHERPAAAARSTPGPRKAPPEQTHAENFYYQKQMQTRTPIVVVLRDGERLQGVIEWYDKRCIKLHRGNGQSNLLIYKPAIKYLYKQSEGPENNEPR